MTPERPVDKAEEIAGIKHIVVFGASGVRCACRVCRKGSGANGEGEVEFLNSLCEPSEVAIQQFEKSARYRIEEALADLSHAASVRAILARKTTEPQS